MSKEILFKAKRKDWKTFFPKEKWWIEGFIMYDSEGRYFIIQLTDDNSLKVPLKDIPVTIEVDPETVCQYIGKTDINGKKIFENDMISCKTISSDGTQNMIGRIEWLEEKMCFGISGISYDRIKDIWQNCSVLGSYLDE